MACRYLSFKLSSFLSGVQLLRTFEDSQNSECARRLRVGGRRSIALIRSGIIARCLASKVREKRDVIFRIPHVEDLWHPVKI